MTDFLSKVIGPLNKNSCFYFLIITLIFFVLLAAAILGNIFWLFKNYKKVNFRIFAGSVVVLFNIFIAYFVNRLLYTMCTKSLV